MIILKHLTVERFRLLHRMDLHFPQRGSILIQGPNEAGKSALLESIYFALYGESLMFDRNKRSLDDLILYGADNASVTLILSVGPTELTVARTIERGKGQEVVLQVRRLGMPEEEPVTDLDSANQRIITELGGIDGETLRNSYLLEQKGLNRLEQLDGSEREVTVRNLLGLEKLTRIGEQFEVTAHDEELLKEATERVCLAELQVRIPELSKQLNDVETALDAVTVLDDLADIRQQEVEIAEQELSLEQIGTRRADLKSRQVRVQQLKKAEATLGEIIDSYDEMAEANREVPILEKQIAELERREQEELPGLEQRVSELVELTKSFGTLQRMSNDLLTAVESIKDLEQELKQYNELQDDLKGIDEQVEYARGRAAQTQKTLADLEDRERTERPTLEARLERMKTLADRLIALRQLEEQYSALALLCKRAEASGDQLKKVQHDLQEAEQELTLVEAEAKQVQQQAEALEKRSRQLSVRRQLEEWQRLKGLSQGLSEAEQQVREAHGHQARLTEQALKARSSATTCMILVIACVILFLLCAIGTVVELTQHASISGVLLAVLALLLIAGAGLSYRNYRKARVEEQAADKKVQDAISRVSTTVEAREAAVRMGGNHEALEQVESELRVLTGTVPRSIDEAQSLLQQTQDQGESIADLQAQIQEKRDEANVAQKKVNGAMQAVTNLRETQTQLEEQQQRLGDIEQQLHRDQAAIARTHQEITLLAGQEGLPQSSVNARLQSNPVFDEFISIPITPVLWSHEENVSGVPELDDLIESTIKATEQELASLDSKADSMRELSNQIKVHQDSLDVMLTRKQIVEERNERYKTETPEQQIERAREQQAALRSALQSLQESLRQRVKTLGVVFGQAAISNAEASARKQLEQLHVILGNKFTLETQKTMYTTLLKERQEALAEDYKQLSKFSNTLGSWIVPPNPFPDALAALRTRCQKELEEANEANILEELDRLQAQEGASNAKIELCRQEIEDAQEHITTMLVRRNRPTTQKYTFNDIVAVWPLLAEYSAQDRSRLQAEREVTEAELDDLEQQELDLSKGLQTDTATLDLSLERTRLEQQERSYQVKKHGNLLVKAANERLLSKIVPRIEHYMQQILPLLTSGRYHDVRLTTSEEERTISSPLEIQVWDSAAGEYVSKSALSGGAADQLSLALRLAFATATLPRELNASSGFLCLDEPLSSFDRGRTQGLVDVVTGDMLGGQFEQILLISHSSAFDPALFPYHVYMDNGAVVESNLPVVQVSTPPPTNEAEPELDVEVPEEDEQDMTVRVAAIPVRVGGE